MMSIGPCSTNFNKSSALPAKPRARLEAGAHETVGVWGAQAAHLKLIGYPMVTFHCPDVTMFESTFGGP